MRMLLGITLITSWSACGTHAPSAGDAPAPVSHEGEVASGPNAADLLSDADARRLTPRLRDARRSSDEVVRVAAFTALARLHDPAAALLLRDGLRDASPNVRAWAARGLGALADLAPEDADRWLLMALAAESAVGTRAALLEALGRVGREDALDAWGVALSARDAEERMAACAGLGEYGRRGSQVVGRTLARLLEDATGDAGPDVLVACTEALGRVPGASPRAADIEAALVHLAASTSPEVRTLAFRGLARRGQGSAELVGRGAVDRDWRTATAALGALAPRSDVAFRAVCEGLIQGAGAQDWSADDASLALHRLRAAVSACGRWARNDHVNGLAHSALAQVARGRVSDARGSAHCVLAGYVDRGRGWPNESPRCGLERVSAESTAVQSARVLSDVPGADAQRWVFLERLTRNASLRVREAVLQASGTVAAEGARDFLLASLRDSDRGVVDTALTVLLERSSVWARGGQGDGMARVPGDSLVPAMRAAYATLRRLDDLEGLGLYVDVLGRLALAPLDSTLDGLAVHWNVAVRSKARALIRSLGRELPDHAVAEVPQSQRVVIGSQRSLPRVGVHTSGGDFVLELRPDAAPVTSARFLQLVESGFYAGLTFHRVVPGFVVQGGDPRGDGYGGPDFSQRCEDNELVYERGSVGMALAGRDTGGSQFFITYGAEPSLDGRYTIFARVASGMEVVEQLQPGDRMLELTRL